MASQKYKIMEFDKTVKFNILENFTIASNKNEDDFLNIIWEICHKRASGVGDAGGGEFWLDYSTPFKTRYIICKVSEIEDGGQDNHVYDIVLKGGAKAGRIGDIIMLIAALTGFWCLSRLLVPQPPIIFAVGFAMSVIVFLGMLIFSGKAFGRDEAANIKYEIQNRK